MMTKTQQAKHDGMSEFERMEAYRDAVNRLSGDPKFVAAYWAHVNACHCYWALHCSGNESEVERAKRLEEATCERYRSIIYREAFGE